MSSAFPTNQENVKKKRHILQTVHKRILLIAQTCLDKLLVLDIGLTPGRKSLCPVLIHSLKGESVREIADDGEGDEAESPVERDQVAGGVLRPEELRSDDACKVTEAVDAQDQ